MRGNDCARCNAAQCAKLLPSLQAAPRAPVQAGTHAGGSCRRHAIPLFGNFSGQVLGDHASAAAARQAAPTAIGGTAAVAFAGTMQLAGK